MSEVDSVKAERIINRVLLNIQEYFEQFGRPIKSGDLIKRHRGAVAKAGMQWSDVDASLKEKELACIRLSKKNLKWYFPTSAALEEADMDELVSLLEPAR